MSLITKQNLLLFLWVLRLFKPEWILSYYIPGIGIIRAIPTVILYLIFLGFCLSKEEKRFDKPYLLFFLSILISTIFAENTGLGRLLLRDAIDSFIFYTLSVSIMRADKDTDRLINLYLASLVFYGICGILHKGTVPFHVALEEEDAFGPFMAMGVPLSFYAAFRDKETKYRNIIIAFLCAGGVIASFARGAFISLCAVLLYIWYKFHNKIVISFALGLFAIVVVIAAGFLFKQNLFWKEMATISRAHEEDTGRKFLWNKALVMFTSHPIAGVGPGNFGFVLFSVTTEEELEPRGVRLVQVYGRVVHNIYLQILAELGLLGAFSFIIILFAFWKRHKQIQMSYKESSVNDLVQDSASDKLRKKHYYSLAVTGAMLGYLVNGLFYEILFYHWLPDLLILNYLIYANLYSETSK